jgi:hypothetical protein
MLILAQDSHCHNLTVSNFYAHTVNIQSHFMMSSLDSLDITFPASGSQLLSESPMLPSPSHTGPGGDDLSISELSSSDRTLTFQKPFSLLASPPTPARGEEGGEDLHIAVSEEGRKDDDSEKAEQGKRHDAKLRDEKLQSDIFILKKLNASFALFNEALQDAGSANHVR